MGRVRIFIVLALAVTAGGVFAVGTYNYVQKVSQPTQADPAMPTQPVVVAVNDLDVGAEIRAEDVKVIKLAEGLRSGAGDERPEGSHRARCHHAAHPERAAAAEQARRRRKPAPACRPRFRRACAPCRCA